MARPIDVQKWRLWWERLRHFKRSHKTVRQWCQAQGVSDAPFYQWRCKLKVHDQLCNMGAPGRTAYDHQRLPHDLTELERPADLATARAMVSVHERR